MGLLLDCEGGDLFQAENFSQGTAMDSSSAALIDQQGNDVSGVDSVQGTGINHSAGILLDYDGDNEYGFKGQHGQGHARESNSLGILLDYRGFDRYIGGPFCRGSVINLYQDTGHVLGVFIDHRGKTSTLCRTINQRRAMVPEAITEFGNKIMEKSESIRL